MPYHIRIHGCPVYICALFIQCCKAKIHYPFDFLLLTPSVHVSHMLFHWLGTLLSHSLFALFFILAAHKCQWYERFSEILWRSIIVSINSGFHTKWQSMLLTVTVTLCTVYTAARYFCRFPSTNHVSNDRRKKYVCRNPRQIPLPLSLVLSLPISASL